MEEHASASAHLPPARAARRDRHSVVVMMIIMTLIMIIAMIAVVIAIIIIITIVTSGLLSFKGWNS